MEGVCRCSRDNCSGSREEGTQAAGVGRAAGLGGGRPLSHPWASSAGMAGAQAGGPRIQRAAAQDALPEYMSLLMQRCLDVRFI